MRSSPFWPQAAQPLLQVAYRHAASPVGLLDGPEVGDTFSRGGSGPEQGARGVSGHPQWPQPNPRSPIGIMRDEAGIRSAVSLSPISHSPMAFECPKAGGSHTLTPSSPAALLPWPPAQPPRALFACL